MFLWINIRLPSTWIGIACGHRCWINSVAVRSARAVWINESIRHVDKTKWNEKNLCWTMSFVSPFWLSEFRVGWPNRKERQQWENSLKFRSIRLIWFFKGRKFDREKRKLFVGIKRRRFDRCFSDLFDNSLLNEMIFYENRINSNISFGQEKTKKTENFSRRCCSCWVRWIPFSVFDDSLKIEFRTFTESRSKFSRSQTFSKTRSKFRRNQPLAEAGRKFRWD